MQGPHHAEICGGWSRRSWASHPHMLNLWAYEPTLFPFRPRYTSLLLCYVCSLGLDANDALFPGARIGHKRIGPRRNLRLRSAIQKGNQGCHSHGGNYDDEFLCKWEARPGGCGSIDSAAVGAARLARTDRHEIWLRDGALRSVHRASGREGDPLLRGAGVARGREARNNHRGAVQRSVASAAKVVDRAGRAAMRVLPIRANHERSGAAGGDSQTHG